MFYYFINMVKNYFLVEDKYGWSLNCKKFYLFVLLLSSLIYFTKRVHAQNI